MFKLNGLAILLLFFNSCKPKHMVAQVLTEAPKTAAKVKVVSIPNPVNDTTFVSIKEYSSDFVFDMKYASPDNFLKQQVYDCAECFLRYATIKKLINANNEFITRGFRIKLYDCYRPLDIQKKMWKIVSNPMYVADPKKGSIHNRGGAVDITLVDKNGNELDMGTKFDHFGKEAGHNYLQLSENVLENRTLLREVMLNNGFTAFESEWWHYNSIDGNLLPLANFKWQCN
jgi:D-alanyl-D-alanine dipeptidase